MGRAPLTLTFQALYLKQQLLGKAFLLSPGGSGGFAVLLVDARDVWQPLEGRLKIWKLQESTRISQPFQP